MRGGGQSRGVFISYRRASSRYIAVLLRDRLGDRGFDVFLDLESLDNGRFEDVILQEIATPAHFVVLLDPETRQPVTVGGLFIRAALAGTSCA